VAVVTVTVVWLAEAGGLFASAAASAAASPTRVTVRITNSRIVFAPIYAPTGTLVFTVLNRTSSARAFGVGARGALVKVTVSVAERPSPQEG
jgi:hypothetical protein